MFFTGQTAGLPLEMFALSGATQVCAKAFTSLALVSGVSFPVVTLAKSGKMVPVMIGSLLLGGAKYSLREYASVSSCNNTQIHPLGAYRSTVNDR
jgi:UDP-galactose transporter B1